MARALFIIIWTLLASAILAVPTQKLRKRTFKVHRIENRNYVADGKMAVKRAYLKFGVGDIESKPDGDVSTRVKAAGNDTNNRAPEDGQTAAVATQNDAQFLSPISVGGQQLIVNFDTGSSDLWVFNSKLGAAQQRGHTVYDSTKSRTVSQPDVALNFNITYGDGSFASGPVVCETVDIGGSTVARQAVGVPDRLSNSFIRDTASSGLLGLGFKRLNTMKPVQQKTFFEKVLQDLSQPVFTAQLKGGTVGAYEFGRIDKSAFVGELAQIPIDASNGFWQFPSTKVTVNGKSTAIIGTAIADTGTSLMLVGTDMLTAYWTQVTGAVESTQAGGFIFPCNTKLPDLEVAVGDHMAKIAGVNFNFATVGRGDNGQNMCFGGLQSRGALRFSIYGDVFFKSQFVAFQANGPTNGPSIGVAPHA